MSVTHAFVSAATEGGDATKVRTSNWNADHVGNGLGWYNVTDSPYNATGDGVTDDTTAIASAITAAAAAGGVVYFPAGTYITSPITLPPGVVLQGANGQAYYNATPTVPNEFTISRLKLKSGSTSALISPNDGGTNLATSVRIRDLNLDCNGLTQPAINLPDQGTSMSRFWLMDRVYVCNIGGATGYAVYIGQNNAAIGMRDCIIFNGTTGSPAGHDAVGWYGPDGFIENTYIGYFAGTGLSLLGGVNILTMYVVGGGIFTCTTGISVGGAGATFIGVSIDHNFNDGVYVFNYPVTFIGCMFGTNSRTSDNQWSDITIENNNAIVSVIGCTAGTRAGETTNNPKYFIDTRGHTGIVLTDIGNAPMAGHPFGTGYTDYTGATTAPTFPASTVAATNTKGADVQAFIANGTGAITAVTLGTTVTGLTIAANAQASILIPQGQTIKFTYGSGTPTWTWVLV